MALWITLVNWMNGKQEIWHDLYASDFAMERGVAMFDHGFQQAGGTLSSITGTETQLSVTRISRNSTGMAYKAMLESGTVSVMQEFQAEGSGALLLLLDLQHYSQIINGCANDSSSTDAMSEIDNELLCELGNIVLNGMLRTTSIIVASRLDCTRPIRPSAECMKRNFSDSGVYQSDVSTIDIEYSWQENGCGFSVPLSMQLHLENNAYLQIWETLVYHSFDAGQK